ncbi:MAG: NifU N-terminal domain-containing protein, partial [Flavobacteriaceae bacterium]|nr:NifU N-terminal domain-containing protein [Flavobacteriaceae bacterium]
MSNVQIKPTTNPAILKFEADRFLTDHQSYELKNIEEASVSPVAQQLFHFPFVKTVYIAQNFVAVEKFNIVDWPDVQEEVQALITDFVMRDAVLKTTTTEKPAISIYAESTPNPEVLKFVANIKLALKPTEFETATDAEPETLTAALFGLPFVKKVFADDNYVSVTKTRKAPWPSRARVKYSEPYNGTPSPA